MALPVSFSLTWLFVVHGLIHSGYAVVLSDLFSAANPCSIHMGFITASLESILAKVCSWTLVVISQVWFQHLLYDLEILSKSVSGDVARLADIANSLGTVKATDAATSDDVSTNV